MGKKGLLANVQWVQLATRIPKSLHMRLKEYSVIHDASIMEIVCDALETRLKKAHLKVVQKESA